MAQVPDPGGSHPRLLAVLGWPVAHSLSPAMHQAAFREQGVNALYAALAVAPADLPAALAGLRALGFLGANVTLPHKERALDHLDVLADDARLIGAVNTIAVRDGRLWGGNTDGAGFMAHLGASGVQAAGARVVLLGAGGAARALAVALALGSAAHVAVLNRTEARAAEVAALAARAAAGAGRVLPVAAAAPAAPEAVELLAGAGLVVNCTPLGMHPDPDSLPLAPGHLAALAPGTVVYDTVYRPAETRLLQEARTRGLRGVGGLGMLAHQGALAWAAWFGFPGPADVMLAAAAAALQGRP